MKNVTAMLGVIVIVAGLVWSGCSKSEGPAGPSTDNWIALPALNNAVGDMTIYNGDLIVGGMFTSAGGTAVNYLARWDGSSWNDVGGGVSGGAQGLTVVYALTVYNGNLIVAGRFAQAGSVAANNVAAWNGTSWTALGSGIDAVGLVNGPQVMTVFEGGLIVGGIFSAAGSVAASNIARWNGSAWSSLGAGVSGGAPSITAVYALGVYDSALIVGGNFKLAGTDTVNNVARWNGSSWSALGTGTSGSPVFDLTVFGADLVIAGDFTAVGGMAANRVAMWNGSSWSSCGSGTNDRVDCAFVSNNRLVVGGWFGTAGGTSARRIARWDRSSWTPLGNGLRGGLFGLTSVTAMALHNGQLIVGGNFTTAGDKTVGYIAGWRD